ncbi:hypothetical protein MW290_21020 [Aquincola tertiaricarbonis]|uniref:Uncharacterized protein n=1 Tax=Aquincola tertiaricarbonis TaxID=391953 RepID=A0ABY4SEM5_AQUTE|nr:hypothetical protein [Aquincola tertiaricarbonis]URI11428.1 hypothetical protein MW290_21020 [Aquincola tertiaricarbonis]
MKAIDAKPVSCIPGASEGADLSLTVVAMGYDLWEGTSAQLAAEGLIPAGFEWPSRDQWKGWTAGPMHYLLHRRKPHGFKGPRRAWMELDHWRLRRTLATHRNDAFFHARLHEARQELACLEWGQTAQGREAFRRWLQAGDDRAFQRFLKAALPARGARRGQVATGRAGKGGQP